ncbi:MAG TPA: isoprenylcysteine carboxylmethyltransferase family protein [Shinella sp.]|jgi:protein-S-isoprenylcysteine O-methyltransferase Ste14|uniref:methyltransferase family protein n=1 Tax=Shinella sp. TaxID=1870904 RepID=UPI002E10683A|nr:isoprenylcysteine carboxylmethyltransferase family protein [Shinella sp.]
MAEVRAPFLQQYRINTLRVFAAVAFALLAVTSSPSDLPVVNSLLELTGLLAIFTAIAGRVWSLFYIGGRKNAELVTDGPYSITRNPLYLFSLIGIAGLGAQTGSLLSMVAMTGIAYFAFDMAMRGEEAFLAGRYGQSFEHYRRLTPRLLPDFALWREAGDTPLRSVKAVSGLKDGAVFLAAWLGIELIKMAQAAELLPVFWTLPF